MKLSNRFVLTTLSFLSIFVSLDLYAQTRKLRNTHYYLIDEKDFPSEPRTETLRDPQGNILYRVSARFKKKINLEGSGKLLNGKVANYATRDSEGEIRYHFTRHINGRGIGDCPLVPFKSIAVDPEMIPLGSLVYIPKTKGMKLPGGAVHNGYWRAVDIGSAIKKDRMDIFIGRPANNVYLEYQKITHLEALTVTVVEKPTSQSCVYKEPSFTNE